LKHLKEVYGRRRNSDVVFNVRYFVDCFHMANSKHCVGYDPISSVVLRYLIVVSNDRRFKMKYNYNGTLPMRRVREGAGRPRKGYRVVRLLVKVGTAEMLEKLTVDERGAFVDAAVEKSVKQYGRW